MSKKPSVSQRLASPAWGAATRAGEGIVIGTLQPSTDGGATNPFTIDLSSARVPDRRYAAEVGAVLLSENIVRLFFAQTKPIGAGLSSLLEIHIAFTGARAFLASMSGLSANARQYMKRFNVKVSPLLDLTQQQEPAQMATVDANIVLAAFSGREACMDFYHSSSFARQAGTVAGKLVAEPVVRVTLSLSLLMAINDWFEGHKDELPADELEGKI